MTPPPAGDFINTIIFPGGCCPSLAAITDAMMKKTSLIVNSIDQFNLHYGETLRRWRANFNACLDTVIRPLGFDDQFIRTFVWDTSAATPLLCARAPADHLPHQHVSRPALFCAAGTIT